MKFIKETTPTIKQAVGNFIDWCREQEFVDKTIENRRLCLEAYLVKEWGNRLVTEITTHEIRGLINTRLEGRSVSQKKNVLKYIRLMYKFLVERGDIRFNPSPCMKFPVIDKLKAHLAPSEVRKLLEHARLVNSEWYSIWATALYTGMRNGELLGLTWDDISFEANQIKVRRTYKPYQKKFTTTKTKHERTIDIAPPLIPILKKLKIGNFDEPFVLPRIDKWDKGEQARELRTFLMGMGLPPIRFHDLRATWATILLSKGIPATVVMVLGGWRNIKTVQFYLRLSGVETQGVLSELELHDPFEKVGKVLSLISE